MVEDGIFRDRGIRGGKHHSDLLFDVANYTFLTLLSAAILYPLILVVSYSFSMPAAVVAGRVWLLPVQATLNGYRHIFSFHSLWTGYANSLYYTVVGTAVSVALTVLAAYPLSRRDFFGRSAVTFLFLFTMLFNAGLVPTFLLVRRLGIYDTRWALILPNAVVVYNLIITRTFFVHSIPPELREAATLDGCDDFNFLRRVVVPLSGPVIAVITLWYAVVQWNSYFYAMVYLKNQMLFPLQLVLRALLLSAQSLESQADFGGDVTSFELQQGLAELIRYGLVIIASLPMLMLYPFIQRFFVKGVMLGSVKG